MGSDASAQWRLGNQYSAEKRWQAALEAYAAALACDPGLVAAYLNRGNVLQVLERWSEALEAYDRALALRPGDGFALSNRGVVLKELQRFDEALEAFDLAVAREPANMTARYNRGLLALLLGRLEQGFRDYEARWQDPCGALHAVRRELGAPRWSGCEPLGGRRILLHAEQGFGDTLQFCRYVPLLAAQGAQVALEVPVELLALLADLPGVARIVAAGRTLPAFDCHCPLLSVPAALQTTLATIPRQIPYLRAEPAKVEEWRERLADLPRPWVGLAWAGSRAHPNDRNRSIALQALLAGLPEELPYVSVQRDLPDADRPALAAARHVHEWTSELHDFSDTAALVAAVDLVISVDTSVAHLAGGLGKPCWVMLSSNPDWRWLLERCDSPWYPSLVLFRQERCGDWAPVLARVAAALRDPRRVGARF
jgi:tetratricopeptide (TPR) repeat protein